MKFVCKFTVNVFAIGHITVYFIPIIDAPRIQLGITIDRSSTNSDNEDIYSQRELNAFGQDPYAIMLEENKENDEWTGELLPVRLGEQASLECRVDSNPPARLSWRHGHNSIAHSGEKLVIWAVDKRDLGEYVCEARSPVPNFPLAVARRFLLPEGT
jgi:hypothetical protein